MKVKSIINIGLLYLIKNLSWKKGEELEVKDDKLIIKNDSLIDIYLYIRCTIYLIG